MSIEFIATIALILGGVNFILVCFCFHFITMILKIIRTHFDSHLND